MYTIQSIEGNRWRIVDGSSRLVFVGDKAQAEAWLDWQENVRPRPSIIAAFVRALTASTARPLAQLWRAPQAAR